jgi:hypothetical protein
MFRGEHISHHCAKTEQKTRATVDPTVGRVVFVLKYFRGVTLGVKSRSPPALVPPNTTPFAPTPSSINAL